MERKKEKFLWDHYYKNYNTDINYPDMSLYEYMIKETKEFEDYAAINYFGRKITYKIFLEYIDKCARSFKTLGVREGDVVTLCMLKLVQL